MNINKAIRKQNKLYKGFLQSMGFIFLILPLVMFLSKRYSIFFIVYLLIIEALIITAIIIRASHERLKFEASADRIRIKAGLFAEEYSINTDKVAIVHTEGSGERLEIIIITTSRFRNNKIKRISSDFLKKYTYAAFHYYRIKKQQPEVEYYYFIITKGGYYKYNLIDLFYKSCLRAYFTENAINTLKEYRH